MAKREQLLDHVWFEPGTTEDETTDLVQALLGELHPPREHSGSTGHGYQHYGYWEVLGVRHRAVVRASNAAEAIERAERAGLVADWEMAVARFVGPICSTRENQC